MLSKVWFSERTGRCCLPTARFVMTWQMTVATNATKQPRPAGLADRLWAALCAPGCRRGTSLGRQPQPGIPGHLVSPAVDRALALTAVAACARA